jgi:hypothetical protein
MPILDQYTQYQISDLIEACASYWELRGVAPGSRNEMRLELEQHVTQAVRDGKSLEAVIGPNPPAFAEAWAREMRPRIFRGGIVVLPVLVYALSVVSTTALIQQLLAHSPSFTFTLFTAYLLISSSLLALLIPLSGFLAPRIRTRQGRVTLLCALVVLVVLALREAGMRVNWSMALLNWSWPLTLVLFALAAFLYSLEYWRTANRERTSCAGRVPLVRSVMAFVGSVAVFDVMLFVGSVAVFNVCTLAGKLL